MKLISQTYNTIIQKIFNFFRWKFSKSSREKALVMHNYDLQNKSKMIFIHIPKAAGISVHKSLFGFDSVGHVSLTAYQKYLKPSVIKQFKIVSFVRNPYTRLLSSYFYLKNGGRGNKLDLKYQSLFSTFKSFEEFILLFLDEQNIYKFEHLVPQVYWLMDKNKELNIDFIGRFENLENDYNTISKWLKNTTSLMHLNKTKQKTKTLFSEEMLEIINKLYYGDFMQLNYEMKTKEFYL